MPIDFGPPSAQVQPYQITPTQYTDPLETLARMQQMRTQTLQQQNAQLQLQMAQQQMESKKGVIRWLADQGATQETQPAAPAAAAPSPAPSPFVIPPVPGAIGAPTTGTLPAAPSATPATAQTPPSTDSSFLGRMARDASKYGILPEDWFAIQNHYLTYKKENALLTETQQKIQANYAQAMAGAYKQLAQKKNSDQGDLNATNNGLISIGVPREWLMTTYPVLHEDVTPQMQILAHGNGKLKLDQMQASEKEEAEIAQAQAGTAEKKAATTKTGLETTGILKKQLVSDIHALPIDPDTLTPTPSAWATVLQNPDYKNFNLPNVPTKDYIDKLSGSIVEEEKRPEYELRMQGLTGNTDFDQFLLKYARDLNKTPATMTADEMGKAKRAYTIYSRDPAQLALEQTRLALDRQRLAIEQRNAGLDASGNPLQYHDAQGNLINISPAARQIAAYKMAPISARSMATNRGLVDQILAVNPNWDIGQYEQRYKTFADLGPGGNLGQNYIALNTLIRHSDDLMDAIDALGGTSFTPANAGYQTIRQLFGSSAPTNFDQLKQYVVGETVKLIRSGGGNLEDEKNAAANLNRANSPQQLKDALQINFGVAGGRMQANDQAVRRAINEPNFSGLDPGATQILVKRGYDPATMKPAAKAPAGGPPPGAPPGAVAVPLKSGTTLWLTPAAAAQLRKDHPERVK